MCLLPIMFDLPSRNDVKEIMVSKDAIQNKAPAVYVLKDETSRKSA
jgi:ATP-dependent protease Clp ATPase subunit